MINFKETIIFLRLGAETQLGLYIRLEKKTDITFPPTNYSQAFLGVVKSEVEESKVKIEVVFTWKQLPSSCIVVVRTLHDLTRV